MKINETIQFILYYIFDIKSFTCGELPHPWQWEFLLNCIPNVETLSLEFTWIPEETPIVSKISKLPKLSSLFVHKLSMPHNYFEYDREIGSLFTKLTHLEINYFTFSNVTKLIEHTSLLKNLRVLRIGSANKEFWNFYESLDAPLEELYLNVGYLQT